MNNKDTKTTKLKYPKYNDGMVLTSQDLNNSFDFLHEQLKGTRSLLFGQGILNGLTCKYDSGKGAITISPGRALTASGSLIEISEEMVLRYYVKKDLSKLGLSSEALADDEIVLELESEPEANSMALENLENKDDYLLGLQAIYKEIGDEYCTEQSCMIRGNQVEISIVPFLLMKANSAEQSKQDASINPIAALNAPSASGWADYKMLPIFLRKVADGFSDRIEAIIERLRAIDEIKFEGLLSDSQWQWLDSLLDGGIGLRLSMDRLGKIHFNNRQINTYLSFVNDVHEAVNEFIAFYNDFQSRYRLVLGNRLEETIILGKLVAANDNTDDAMRYTLMETYRDYDRSKDERILVRLLKRITLLIDEFSPELPEVDSDLRFVPSSVSGKLGERDIPFYYQKANLKDYWDAHNDIHVEKQTVDAASKDAFDKADLYRLSFDKLNATDFVLADLRSQAKANNLPVIILKYELEGDDVSYCLEDYDDDMQGLDASFDGKTIADRIFEKGMIDENDKKAMKDVIEQLKDCYDKFDVKEASQKVESAKLHETLIEEIRQSIWLLTKEEELEGKQLETIKKNALEFIMMAILYHRTEKENKDKLLKPVNMPGIDFVGGVEKRDVMLLVTHRDKVLTCLNMPYLSLLLNMNQEMFKDQLEVYNMEKETSDLPTIFALKGRGRALS